MDTILFYISSTRHTCRNRLEGIYAVARRRNWHVQVVERAFHRVNVRDSIDFWRPVGVIAECGSGADELKPSAFDPLPVVWFDAEVGSRGPGLYTGIDSAAVGRVAAAHLLSLGLSNYAYASFRLPLFWARNRRDAFVDAVECAGKGVFAFDPGCEQTPRVRQRALADWLASLPKPCGVFAANDYVGEEILNTCGQIGLKSPDDIAVLGVDDDEALCENLSPTLSSIPLDFGECGRIAAEMLASLIDGRDAGSDGGTDARLVQPGGVTVRQSTRRLACDRSRVAAAVETIRLRACEGISVDDVVAVMGEPRRTAEMHFREATGRSIHEEIDEIRFARVFALLKNPRQSLGAIPALCGFATGVALRKAFRIRTGASMRDWRKSRM